MNIAIDRLISRKAARGDIACRHHVSPTS